MGVQNCHQTNLVRINQDGSPDLSFSAIGSDTMCFSQQVDGKYIVSGYKSDFSEGNGIVRLNTNGTTDSTFVPGAVDGTMDLQEDLPLFNLMEKLL